MPQSYFKPVLLIVVITFGLQACVSITGRKIPLDKLSHFKQGDTKQDEVVALIGKPENIINNTLADTSVYSYQWVASKIIGIGVPPWLVLLRKDDVGFKLDVAFIGGVYIGHTLTKLNQKMLRRKDRKSVV